MLQSNDMGKSALKEKSTTSLGWSLLHHLPVFAPAGLAVFSAVSLFLVLLGQFNTEYVWSVGPVLSVTAMALVILRLRRNQDRIETPYKVFDLLTIIGVLVWVVININFTSQHIFTNRDPATYTIAGAWLADNPSLEISSPEVFKDVQGLKAASAGFRPGKSDKSNLEAQGTHLLPAVIGAAGKIVGKVHALRAGPLIGGVALLAMYAFARLVVKPYWAAVATAAVAASLPMLYFSRDTYTEPLTMVAVFGGLAMLWKAQELHSRFLWGITGFLFGVATLSRVDGWLALIGVCLFLVFYLMTQKRADRHRALAETAILLAGLFATSLIGMFDLWNLSSTYYSAFRPRLLLEIYLILAIVVFAPLAVFAAWRTNLIREIDRRTRNWRAQAAAIVILAAGLILLSRPLWLTTFHTEVVADVGVIQQESGLAVLPRKYIENSVEWLGWYIGPALVALGFIGMSYASTLVFDRKNFKLLAGLLSIGLVTFLYIIKPSITPDHVWAARRYIPVIIPGLCIFGMLAVQKIYDRFFSSQRLFTVYSIALGIFFVLTPLLTAGPLLFQRDTAQLIGFEETCRQLPEDSAVVWLGLARLEAVMPTRAFCEVPSAGFRDKSNLENPDEPTVENLRMIAEKISDNGRTPIVGLYGSNTYLIEELPVELNQAGARDFQELERTLLRPPNRMEEVSDPLLLGVVQKDGTVVPLSQ